MTRLGQISGWAIYTLFTLCGCYWAFIDWTHALAIAASEWSDNAKAWTALTVLDSLYILFVIGMIVLASKAKSQSAKWFLRAMMLLAAISLTWLNYDAWLHDLQWAYRLF